jgi:hypothetical protein
MYIKERIATSVHHGNRGRKEDDFIGDFSLSKSQEENGKVTKQISDVYNENSFNSLNIGPEAC